jgi:exodeoxyribonuclease VII large subunit
MSEDLPLINSSSMGHNTPELSVSEVSLALKKTVETSFSRVRVRGEISGFKRAASGHLYMSLKDEKSVLSAICWRGVSSKLLVNPEDGLEVICTGKLTTFPGRSQYQMIVEQMELAGEGALLKLLEERKKKFIAEGLFDEEHKKKVPFLPDVIGVVTSPTGAVIRDIMHRIIDRFPRQVLLYPSMVQGDGASKTIAAGIKAFNEMKQDGITAYDGKKIKKPDVIIVARGGGSLEDLWCFNEEEVVRAVFDSKIPVISAVGHETDTMLIDYVADLRAPTPTGAAEKAVPVKLDIVSGLQQSELRLTNAINRVFKEYSMQVESLSRGIPNIANLTEEYVQKLDDRFERLENSFENYVVNKTSKVLQLGAMLKSPNQLLADSNLKLKNSVSLLENIWLKKIYDKENSLSIASSKLSLSNINKEIVSSQEKLSKILPRLETSYKRNLSDVELNLENISQRLENCSFERVLERGYTIVKDKKGKVITTKDSASKLNDFDVLFADGALSVSMGAKKVKKKAKKQVQEDKQGSLF